MSTDTFLVGNNDQPRPVRTVTVQGQEGDVQYGSLPDKTCKLDESCSMFVQHKKTVVITDRLSPMVHMYSLDSGRSTTIQNAQIVAPRQEAYILPQVLVLHVNVPLFRVGAHVAQSVQIFIVRGVSVPPIRELTMCDV